MFEIAHRRFAGASSSKAWLTAVSLSAVVLCGSQLHAQTSAPAPLAAPGQATPANPAATAQQPANPAAAKPGLRTVDPASVKLTFYTVQSADMLASKLLDAEVYNLQNEEIGEVEDIIIDQGRTVRAVVISVGGFLGIGERNVAADPASLVLMRESGSELRIVANTTREDLKAAPEFKFGAK